VAIRAHAGNDSVLSRYSWVERTVGGWGVMCGFCEEAAKSTTLMFRSGCGRAAGFSSFAVGSNSAVGSRYVAVGAVKFVFCPVFFGFFFPLFTLRCVL
jgi:hypothetical protein